MGDLLDFRAGQRKRNIKNIMGQFSNMYSAAGSISEEYFDLMTRDQEEGVKRVSEFISKTRDDINPGGRAMEALAGGPNHDWTTQIMNILGLFYPTLEQPLRETALNECMDFLDGLNYFYSQNHVELIDEPWLAGDIVITRPLYWPGYSSYTDKLQGSVVEYVDTAESKFWATWPVIKIKYASPRFRKEFYETYPVLLDRTLDAVAGTICEYAARKKSAEDTSQFMKEELQQIDPALHTTIQQKMEEKKWILLPQ